VDEISVLPGFDADLTERFGPARDPEEKVFAFGGKGITRIDPPPDLKQKILIGLRGDLDRVGVRPEEER
jgi:hypothetical protein